MKVRCTWIITLALIVAAGCQAKTQPVFTTSTYRAATPIPFPAAKPVIAATLPERIRSFSISPDGKTISFATSQGLVLYDLKSYRRLRTLDKAHSFYLVDWSPDGTKLAAGSLIPNGSGYGESRLMVWDASTWKVVFEQTGSDTTLDSIYGDIAWSPDSRSLATNLNFMGVRVFEIETGGVISHQDDLSPHSIAWSPDGTRLVATGDMASGIRRWKVSTDEAVRLFDPRAGGFMQIAWSPDGKRIASGNFEGKVCFFTALTNRCDALIDAHRNTVFSLAWSADGNQLATGGGIIRIWDTNTGKLIRSFGLKDFSIYPQLVWSGAGQPLVSLEAGYAKAALSIVRFWDADTGKPLFEFDGAEGNWGE